MSDRRPTQSPRRIVILVMMIVVGTGGGLLIISWIEGRSLSQAEAAYQSGDYDLAAEKLNQFLQTHPDNVRAQNLHARLLVAAGHYEQAIEVYQSLGPGDPEDMHAWARALLHQEQWSSALTLLEMLVARRPEDPDILHELSACRAKLGLHRQALEAAQQFAALPGHEARGHLLVGTIHQQTGNVGTAVAAFGEVLKFQPEADDLQIPVHEFFREYGRLLLQDGQPGPAHAALSRSLEAVASAEVWSLYGDAALANGDVDSAVRAWRQAVALDPREVAPRVALANQALQVSDGEQALEWMSPLESSAELTSGIAYLLQRIYALLGQVERAEEWRLQTEELRRREELRAATDQVLVNAPDSMWAWVIRAYHFAEQENWEQAAQSLVPVRNQIESEPFVSKLAQAIEARGPLPPLDDVPIEQY